MDLHGKVVLITGGTRGIGAATALALASRGADVALVARIDDEAAAEVKAQAQALGRRCVMIVADVSVPAEATQCVQEAAQALGRLDVLVHSAGGPASGRLLDLGPEVWYQAFDTHVHAIFHLSRAAVPLIRPNGEGAIILISSVAGIRGVPGSIAYGTVKGAVLQLTRALARDLADDNIRVNCVSPGIIRTRFHAAMTSQQYENNIRNRIPLHREGKPEDVADVIATLVTNDFVTGESVVIDGGMSMRIV